MDGGTLQHQLKEGSMPDADQRIEWARQAASGLSWLHTRRPSIEHRDVKPANMLLNSAGDLKITDFGMAKVAEISVRLSGGTSTTSTQASGTLHFMAPELHDPDRGIEAASKASDVYAFGEVLHAIAFKVPRFSKDIATLPNCVRNCRKPDPKALYEKQEQGNTLLPSDFFGLFCDCVEKQATSRPSMDDVFERLSHMVSELRGGLASGLADGFDGELGKAAVVSLVGEVARWQLITGTCKIKKLHFKGVWRPQLSANNEWFERWKAGVLNLRVSGAASELLVVTYDDVNPKTRSRLGENMKNFEVPFLDAEGITYKEITFSQFMIKFCNWK